MREVTTLDVSNNKLESLEHFQHMTRIKRLVAKNNHIRLLAPLRPLESIYELDLEGNAVDSHIDFLEFIKGKNDLIVVNLHLNPLMVEVDCIERLNGDLIAKAPGHVTRKTAEEISKYTQLMGGLIDHSVMPAHDMSTLTEEHKGGSPNKQPGSPQKSLRQPSGFDDEAVRLYRDLINELSDRLTCLRHGVLYRNRRVHQRIRQLQAPATATRRSASNYSGESTMGRNASAAAGRMPRVDASSQGRTASAKGREKIGSMSPIGQIAGKPVGSSVRQRPSAHGGMPASKGKSSGGHSPILSRKSCRYEEMEELTKCYEEIVEAEELKKLRQHKLLARRRR